ncbi:MAG: hypothetical protein M3N82_01185 [Pseudomonadota bacterium]|nr:hypothetical protein [Pseudomonadota bacterium]
MVSVKGDSMWRRQFILLIGLLPNIGALQAQQVPGQSCPAHFSSIAPPDDKRIGAIDDAVNWTNAFVVVDADGYVLILHGRARSDQRMSLATLRRRLTQLPAGAWPLGRVVAGSENGVSPETDGPIVVRRLAELRALLKTLCLRFDQWPRA